MDTSALHNSDIKTLFLRVLTIAISFLCTAVVTLTKLQIDSTNAKLNNAITTVIRVEEKQNQWSRDTYAVVDRIKEEQLIHKNKTELLESRIIYIEKALRRLRLPYRDHEIGG